MVAGGHLGLTVAGGHLGLTVAGGHLGLTVAGGHLGLTWPGALAGFSVGAAAGASYLRDWSGHRSDERNAGRDRTTNQTGAPPAWPTPPKPGS
jgi:hypothetical protein